MSGYAHAPTRRTFLKGATAAGLALSPLLAARSAAAAEPAALAANISAVDAHVHLWDLSVFPVPWIKGNPVLDQSYVLEDYQTHTAGLGINAIVYVEVAIASEYTLLEADWVVARAAENPLIQGMVAYAPLEYGERVRSYLDALVTRGPLIKGVRRGLPDPKDTRFDRASYLRGIQILSEYGLSFDILGKGTPHLDHAIEIARGAPDTSLIPVEARHQTAHAGPMAGADVTAGVFPERLDEDQRYCDRGGPPELEAGGLAAVRRARAERLRRGPSCLRR